MPCCYVFINGSDGQTHSTTLDAASLFDAANQAVERWAKLWWFDHAESITVQHGEQRWVVTQERVREWREKQ